MPLSPNVRCHILLFPMLHHHEHGVTPPPLSPTRDRLVVATHGANVDALLEVKAEAQAIVVRHRPSATKELLIADLLDFASAVEARVFTTA